MPDADPIRGRVRRADGTERSFDGWLELVELLDRARTSVHNAGEREAR
nr:hypothetical protein [Kibdelosporangium sp. MJ126-NF4]CTQ97093.1 hypothetical protein [Kibdelosporangium sp. MJ126-NF4]